MQLATQREQINRKEKNHFFSNICHITVIYLIPRTYSRHFSDDDIDRCVFVLFSIYIVSTDVSLSLIIFYIVKR